MSITQSSSASPVSNQKSSFRIISARYGKPNEQQYNVKEELKKRISKDPSTTSEILASDKLLRAKASVMTQKGRTDGQNITMNKDTRPVLTVVYEINGKKFTKEAVEGSTLRLP